MDIKKLAREVFEIEAKEIASLSHKLTDDFENAIHAIHQSGAAENQNNQTSTIITLTTNNNQICPVCKRPFIWRKKWKLNWDRVKYCSKKCSKLS